MQTTSTQAADEQATDTQAAGARSCWRRRARLALYFVALFVAVDVVASLCVGTYASLSSVAWSDFKGAVNAGEKISTVFVGSSFGERAFDPIAFDDTLAQAGAAGEGSSYNLSTPGQSLTCTEDAVEQAIAAGADRIVMDMGAETLCYTESTRADIAYLMARNEGDPVASVTSLVGVAMRDDTVGTRDSLNIVFPWVFSSVRNVNGLVSNVQSRVTGEAKGTAAQKVIPDWHYVGRGYGNYDRVLGESDHFTTVGTYGMPWVNPNATAALERICARCQAAGVKLVVVSTPHPAFDTATMGQSYVNAMLAARSIATRYDASFYDFNFATKDVLSLEREDFSDFEHLSLTGATKFSRALAGVIARDDAGQDVSSSFLLGPDYEGFDKWLADHAGWEV